MVTHQQLLTVLSRHIGRIEGITAKRLAFLLLCTERQVRALVSEARESGHAVCGTPRDGYYIAANAAELEETCAFLRNRAIHSLTIESRLRKTPLVELLGQLNLNT